MTTKEPNDVGSLVSWLRRRTFPVLTSAACMPRPDDDYQGTKGCWFSGMLAKKADISSLDNKVTGAFEQSIELKRLKNAKKVIVAKASDGQRYLCPAQVGCN